MPLQAFLSGRKPGEDRIAAPHFREFDIEDIYAFEESLSRTGTSNPKFDSSSNFSEIAAISILLHAVIIACGRRTSFFGRFSYQPWLLYRLLFIIEPPLKGRRPHGLVPKSLHLRPLWSRLD